MAFDPKTRRLRTARLEDDPAYRALQAELPFFDLRQPRDRIEFLALLTLLLAYDPWGYIEAYITKINDTLTRMDRMDESIDFQKRLEDAERKIEQLRKELADTDYAQALILQSAQHATLEENI